MKDIFKNRTIIGDIEFTFQSYKEGRPKATIWRLTEVREIEDEKEFDEIDEDYVIPDEFDGDITFSIDAVRELISEV